MKTIFNMYMNDEITYYEAVNQLINSTGIDEEEAKDIVDAWDSEDDLPAYSQASWYS